MSTVFLVHALIHHPVRERENHYPKKGRGITPFAPLDSIKFKNTRKKRQIPWYPYKKQKNDFHPALKPVELQNICKARNAKMEPIAKDDPGK